MIYEIYLDGIFAEILVWELCVLKLTDGGFGRFAGNKRILAGGIAGAAGSTLSLFVPPFWPGKLLLAAASCAGMLCITFPVRSLRRFLKVLEMYLKHAVLLGGTALLLQRMPVPLARTDRVWLCILTAAALTGAGTILQRKRRGAERGRAVLIRGEKRICADALVDSGNSLTEPVSGKPVCVLDRRTAALLWGEGDLFRAVPYRSVGKKRGILKAYLLPRMELELDGPVRTFREIYVAVSPQELTKEQGEILFLIHPALLTGEQTKNQAETEGREYTE